MMPRATQCTMLLAAQFLLIHLSYFVAQSIHQVLHARNPGYEMERHQWLETLETGLCTVEYAPMLCVLMLSCQMRSDLLTTHHGHPAAWAQDSMVLLPVSIFL